MKKHDENIIHQSGTFLTKYQDYISEFVYGGIDGSITTFAIVAGSLGAGLSSGYILIMGFANLLADGFSMSIGAYLASKSTKDNFEKHKKTEYWEIENMYDVEVEEVREIYRNKGFEGELLEQVVQIIIADNDRWVDVMMKEELEMSDDKKSPFMVGAVTFVSFLTLALVPLSIYVLDYFVGLQVNLILWASILTMIAFGIIGYLKGMVNHKNKLISVLETISMGAVAALVAYFVGYLLEKVIITG